MMINQKLNDDDQNTFHLFSKLCLLIIFFPLIFQSCNKKDSTDFVEDPDSDSETTFIPKLSLTGFNTCLLLGPQDLKCWGYNGNPGNSLPKAFDVDPSIASVVYPHDMDFITSLYSIKEIFLNDNRFCLLTASGSVKCRGYNYYGALGNGTTTDSNSYEDVVGLNGTATQIIFDKSDRAFGCALLSTGGVKCWGQNYANQIGDGTTTTRLTATQVSGLESGVKAISNGSQFACALMNSGGVKCWGNRTNVVVSSTPIDIPGLSNVTAIASGGRRVCVLLDTGGVKCWGNGAIGSADSSVQTAGYSSTPVDVDGLQSGVIAITSGDWHSCALLNTGAVKCWGDGYFGSVGTGQDSSGTGDGLYHTPQQVIGLESGVVAVECGTYHTCALMSDYSTVKCWGYNEEGQVGNGTTTERILSPVDVVFQ